METKTVPKKNATLNKLGGRIRRRRRELGLTLLQLAKKAMLSKTYLCDLEHGRQEPGMGTCDRLAQALGLSLNFLIRGKYR